MAEYALAVLKNTGMLLVMIAVVGGALIALFAPFYVAHAKSQRKWEQGADLSDAQLYGLAWAGAMYVFYVVVFLLISPFLMGTA